MTTIDDLKDKAKLYFSKGCYKDAIKYNTEAILLSPSDHILYSNRAASFAGLKKYSESLIDANECVQLNPDWSKGYTRRALAEFFLGLIDDSIKSYKKAIDLEPSNSSYRTSLNEVEKADKKLYDLIRKNAFAISECIFKDTQYNLQSEKSVDTRNKLMNYIVDYIHYSAYTDDEVHVNINADFRKAVAAFVQKYPVLMELSLKSDKLTEKLIELCGVEASDLASADEWKEKGNALYKERKFQEALNAYDKAIELNPTNVFYYTNKSAVYFEMEDYDSCIKLCHDIINRKKEFNLDYIKIKTILKRVANCYKKMQKYTELIETYNEMLLEENDRETRALLSEAQRLKVKKDIEDYIDPELAEKHKEAGNSYFKRNLFPKAKAEYDEAIRRNPNDPVLYSNRSAAFIKLSEYSLALEDIEKSLSLNDKVVKSWARKGKILTLMKRYNKAINAYEEGLAIDSNDKLCTDGLNEVLKIVHQSTTSDKVDEQQMKEAMYDPEVRKYLEDPHFRVKLEAISGDPHKIAEAMKDPYMATGIQKMISAGIVKIA